MNKPLPRKLPYAPGQFVDRQDELNLVLGKARRLTAGESVERRVILFHGQRGSGKTWLLLELDHCLPKKYKPFESRVISLGPDSDVKTVGEQIPQHRPLALLLDDVSEVSEPLLKQLEEQVLAPLAQDSRVLIALTQRGRPHVWTGPEFREKAEDHVLEPFHRQHVKEQVEQQVPETAASLDDIERLGGGFPWSTYILAEHLPEPTALDHCVSLFLQDVDEDLWPYFEALSVLKAFDETRMAPLFQAFSAELAGQTWDYRARRQVRERLVATTLARWDRDSRGYVLDEPLRLVLEARLLERTPKLWLRLHCVAYRLYGQWAQNYPQSGQWWTQEQEHHQDRIEQVRFDPARCPEEEEEQDGN